LARAFRSLGAGTGLHALAGCARSVVGIVRHAPRNLQKQTVR